MRAMVLIAAFALILAGCKVPAPMGPDGCTDFEDDIDWQLLSSPPPQAELLRTLANAENQPGEMLSAEQTRGEFWFEAPSGEIRLCRVGKDRHKLPNGSWWVFSAGENPQVIDTWWWSTIVLG